MKVTAPIVSTTEDVGSIDGLKKLAKAIHGEFAAQRKAQDVADAHGLEIGRLICEFASRGDVQAQVAVINRKKNGRPQSAHCYIAEQLFVSGEITGLTQRHLERCARAFLKAKSKGLPINTPIRIAEASDMIARTVDKNPSDAQPSPERLFDTDAPADNGSDRDAFDPDRDALRIARKIKEFFFSPQGHPYLRNKKQKDEFAKKLEEAFESVGLTDWAVIPMERK